MNCQPIEFDPCRHRTRRASSGKSRIRCGDVIVTVKDIRAIGIAKPIRSQRGSVHSSIVPVPTDVEGIALKNEMSNRVGRQDNSRFQTLQPSLARCQLSLTTASRCACSTDACRSRPRANPPEPVGQVHVITFQNSWDYYSWGIFDVRSSIRPQSASAVRSPWS